MPRQAPRRSSSRANAGKREREDGFVGDAKQTIAQIIDVVAMHAVANDCGIVEAISKAGWGFLDWRQDLKGLLAARMHAPATKGGKLALAQQLQTVLVGGPAPLMLTN
eukprot:COSAG02_NODE_16560_length_1074_cov_1.778462_1_plen_108_part_00